MLMKILKIVTSMGSQTWILYFDIWKRFYPTRLSLSISICGSAKESGTNQEEFIIVETNYRIYAYTGTVLFHLFSAYNQA